MTVERECDSTSELGDHGKGDLRDAAEHSCLYDGGGKHSADRITRIHGLPFTLSVQSETGGARERTRGHATLKTQVDPRSEIKKVRSLTAIPCTAGVTSSSVQQIQ